MTAPGHAWVAYALANVAQVKEAAARAQAMAAVHNHGDSDDDGGDIPVLDAYSDGPVLANGVEGSTAAVVRVCGCLAMPCLRLFGLRR